MNIPQLPVDKANHAIYGALIFIAVGAVAASLGYAQARIIGVGAAAAAGIAKEVSDWILNHRAVAANLPPPHGVEAADALATIMGAVVCWAAAVATVA